MRVRYQRGPSMSGASGPWLADMRGGADIDELTTDNRTAPLRPIEGNSGCNCLIFEWWSWPSSWRCRVRLNQQW